MTEPKRYRRKLEEIEAIYNATDNTYEIINPISHEHTYTAGYFHERFEPIPSAPRPEIVEFAEEMERRLQLLDPSIQNLWKHAITMNQLYQRLRDQIDEWHDMEDRDLERPVLVNIASLCMMLRYRLKEEE